MFPWTPLVAMPCWAPGVDSLSVPLLQAPTGSILLVVLCTSCSPGLALAGGLRDRWEPTIRTQPWPAGGRQRLPGPVPCVPTGPRPLNKPVPHPQGLLAQCQVQGISVSKPCGSSDPISKAKLSLLELGLRWKRCRSNPGGTVCSPFSRPTKWCGPPTSQLPLAAEPLFAQPQPRWLINRWASSAAWLPFTLISPGLSAASTN